METVYAVHIIELMMEILPDHDPHDVPWFESFSSFEPADLDNEFMEQEGRRRKARLCPPSGLSMLCHSQVVLFGVQGLRRYGAQNDYPTRLAQAVLTGCFGAHMARLCLPSARFVFNLPQHDALAENDAMQPYLSLALPPLT
ncbi:hypothetical protein TNCV_45191 [Trichonephila clavipes]|nr:hypothetical protein TNCV_45191 [Trichonephila clavipes]